MADYTHTVHCFTDPTLRKDFTNLREATAYANKLLARGEKVKIYPYHLPKRPVDYAAERLEKEGRL